VPKKTAKQTKMRRADSLPEQSGLIAKPKTLSNQRGRSPSLTIATIDRLCQQAANDLPTSFLIHLSSVISSCAQADRSSSV